MGTNLFHCAPKNLIIFVLFISALSTTPLALSQDDLYISRDESLGLLYNIGIDQHDGITGNCWTNPDSTINRVTAKLEQAGIHTYDERLAITNGITANLLINTNGFRTNNGLCVGTANLSVISTASTTFGGAATDGTEWNVSHISLIFERETLFSGPKNLNEQILSQIDSFTDELIGMIYKGRRQHTVSRLIEEMPNLRSEPISQREFNKMIQNSIKPET
ncbi:hypothetical protein NPJ88_001075 [Halomonas elongata]|uniref:hypothetical protein n=1 Tax=Halomonas elongata TaxID=2746 RepID=UPI00255AEE05|nr:hypothetical protein [Halomonas elongata]MDL4860918.1 hypothetical protein [Halomonas elongata]